MTATGRLSVDARFAAGRLAALSVDLVRPPVARLFIGQTPAAVLKTVPYLYTLCAQAQRAAAQAALAVAVGAAGQPVDDGALWIEFLHENLWRLLLDWPAALGLAPANAAFVAWRAARQGGERVAATRQLLDDTLPALAEKCREKLVDRSDPGRLDLPVLTPDAWLAYWQGGAAQQPELARPASLAAAFERRLAEVDAAAAALAAGGAYPLAAAGGAGWGIGQTLTARGVLTHAVRVDEDHVKKYRVWAPTDCHFADAGGLTRLLAGRAFADLDAARQGVEQAILALDPCLPYVLEVAHA